MTTTTTDFKNFCKEILQNRKKEGVNYRGDFFEDLEKACEAYPGASEWMTFYTFIYDLTQMFDTSYNFRFDKIEAKVSEYLIRFPNTTKGVFQHLLEQAKSWRESPHRFYAFDDDGIKWHKVDEDGNPVE